MAVSCAFVIPLLSIGAAIGLWNDAALAVTQHTPFELSKPGGTEYRHPVGLNCGDHLCQCDVNHAECDFVTYIPKLPVTISRLRVLPSRDMSQGSITKNFFMNASTVNILNFAFHNVTRVPLGLFGFIRNLTSLSISQSAEPVTDVKSIRYLFSIPTMTKLTLYLGPLPPDALQGIDSYVIDLRLHMCLKHLNLTQFIPLKRLEILKLTGCSIQDVTTDTPIALKQLYLTSNALSYFPLTCQNGTSLYPDLEALYLDHNVITSFHIFEEQICLPKLKILDLSSNLLKRISSGTFSSRNFPSLSILNVKSQRDLDLIDDFAFNNSKLTVLSLAFNKLMLNGQPFFVNLRAFANCANLKELYLDRSNYGEFKEERFRQMFGHLPLAILSMINCDINGISENMFASFSDLQELYLADNKIGTIPDGTFDSLTNLRVLDVSENKLSVITENTFSAITRRRLVQLSLGNNPFTCSCDLLWFRNWLAENASLFYQDIRLLLAVSTQYKCSNIPEMEVDTFTMVEQACLLRRETCIQIIVASSLILLTFTLFSLLFRYRWHIRLILYEGIRARNNVRRLRLQTNNFEYDVFVSYASEDLPWVHEYLMPELEDRLGLRLCVHERDFIPGKNIVDNIANCVQSSKKILMVFSRDFVKSQWCQFELNFCLRHAMDHDDVLIIVCVDDVASREMTTAMVAVLKTTTFIQWERLNDAIDAFWGRVFMSLNEIMEPRRV